MLISNNSQSETELRMDNFSVCNVSLSYLFSVVLDGTLDFWKRKKEVATFQEVSVIMSRKLLRLRRKAPVDVLLMRKIINFDECEGEMIKRSSDMPVSQLAGTRLWQLAGTSLNWMELINIKFVSVYL